VLLRYSFVVLDNRYPRVRNRSGTGENTKRRLRANKLAKQKGSTHKTEGTLDTKIMGEAQPRITMGDYWKRANNDYISLGFQPANPANFDIKGNIVTGLREN
jgi:hypothetical protein